MSLISRIIYEKKFIYSLSITNSPKEATMQPHQFGFNRFLKKIVTAAILTSSSFVVSSETTTSTDEEAFLIRRIAEFWKDGDYQIVREQIYDFIKKYPSSTMKDYLHGILGDLHLQQNDYNQALALYSSIKDPAIVEKIILNKLQCYYEVEDYENIFKEGQNYISNTSYEFTSRKNEFLFVLAEGYFRHGITVSDEQKKIDLVCKAAPFYEQLTSTEYAEISSFALAEIYRLSKQNSKAIEMYLSLAEKYPAKKENVLFNAALLEANIDKNSAIELFDKVVAMNGSKAGEASFNRLVLYFQTECYENVVNEHRLVYSHVPESQMPIYNFVVGKSFFNVKDFESAISPLEKYIITQSNTSEEFRDALILQLTCAKQTSNEPLFDRTLVKFKSFFPDDSEMGKAYFIHAMMLKKEGNFAKAESQLKMIYDQKVAFDDRESLLYEYSVISHENQKYELSYEALKNFLGEFPTSDKKNSAWRYYLSCCLHRSKLSDQEHATYSKNLFYDDLQKVLTHGDSLSQQELKEYRLLHAKLAFELSHYNECLENLGAYISVYPSDENLAEAHLLTALSLSKIGADPEKLCVHLEKAIELSPDLYDTGAIHLQLYNAYISRSQQTNTSPDKHDLYLEKAAQYLYSAMKDASSPVKIENQLWLASYYYSLSKGYLSKHWMNNPSDDKSVQKSLDRSFEIYSKVLASGKHPLKGLDQSQLFLESEALKYAELAGVKGQGDKKIQILKSLVEQQSKHKEWAWQFKRQALYELAACQEKLSQNEAALENYQMIDEYPNLATPITTISALKAAKIKFDLLDKKVKNEKNPQVLSILNKLKDLQIRKNNLSEPAHLEAGLEYVKIRTQLSQDSLKDSRYLFFLVRMKEDFTSTEDLVAKEYLTGLEANPTKQQLYKAYMKFVDAEIFRMQSKQLAQEGRKEDALAYKQKALELLLEIEKEKAPTEYLHAEITKSMKLLK